MLSRQCIYAIATRPLSCPRVAQQIPTPVLAIQHRQPLSTTPHRCIKESEDLHTRGAAEAKEEEKNEQLRKQKEGKGHWHEGLGSDGESAVKADREDIDHSEKGIEGMQKETANKAQEEKGKR